MYRNQRGSISLFVEMLVIIAFILGILYAIQQMNKREIDSGVYYPSGAARQGIPLGAGGSDSSRVGYSKPLASSSITTNSQVSRPVISTQATKSQTVSYTDSGFSPQRLVMPVGTRTLIFKNNSKQLMWPLSSGSLTPPLDATYGFNTGASYTYTFSDTAPAASYEIYNRLNSAHRVTIILP